MLGVLLYEPADDAMDSAPAHFEAHVAYASTYREAGELILLGTFANPFVDGSMAVLSSEEAARRFVKDDPFVINGVVKSWRVLGWSEICNDIYNES